MKQKQNSTKDILIFIFWEKIPWLFGCLLIIVFVPLGISVSKIRKLKMNKLTFYSLLGCFIPFPAWAGDIFIPLVLPCFSLPYVIIPFILSEAGFLFWQLHKEGISKTKAFVTTLWARGYSMLMGIPALMIILFILQFAIFSPLTHLVCQTIGGCHHEDFIINKVFAFGIIENYREDYLTWFYQGILYYISLILLEYGIFQRELPEIDKKRLLKISFIINSITYLIWLIIICIWVAVS